MKKILLITLLTIVLLVTSVTTYKVIKTHNETLLIVSEKRIIEGAKKCWNEKKCEKNQVTLKELYALGYLEKEVNPVTKEFYSEESFIKEENYSFVVLN
ncbi:MAG: hypothetical protein RR189_02570 [Bacilli bacterium]